MTKDNQISKIIIEQLNTVELKEKYLNLLSSRIDENRKTLNSLLIVMVLTSCAFPLIVETKISEIAVGPFKLRDNLFAISIIPSIFSYSYYKYAAIWTEVIEQKFILKNLTSKIFSIKENSYLNERLKPFSFADHIIDHSTRVKSKNWGCFLGLFWIPTIIGLVFFPFLFEYYAVKTLYYKKGLNDIINWVFFLTPIITGIFTILIYYQAGKKLDETRKTEE
ncbi:hypothetical protein [Flavobacterium pectinovorum]|uniref:Uncharacterized protein n=1 Tax=Flavobacterium pectinovorum TaxID=29533 RepID=A0A502E4F2_9FLAO|nr:hypothetical protein [Flavobacterium pectinovorum]TPG31310.1 hypothetical protein EAH81_26955 [Flavobacterium pectinovorum]